MLHIIIFSILILSLIYHHSLFPEEMRKAKEKKGGHENKYFNYVHAAHNACIRTGIANLLMGDVAMLTAVKNISVYSITNVIMSHFGY